MVKSWVTLLGCSLASAVLSISCSSATCAEKGTCGGVATGDGGTGIDSGSACDPATDATCVSNLHGTFVDATSGDDSNPGTKASPTKSIGAALGKLVGKSNVYVCEGTYPEHVRLTAAVSLLGGFICGSWTYSASTKPTIAPPDVGYALEIQNISSALSISDLSFVAQPGTTAQPSSIAGFVSASPSVSLRRVELIAGKGMAGASQLKGAAGKLLSSAPGLATLTGNKASGQFGGLAQVCMCVGGGTSKGGAAGNADGNGADGETAQAVEEPSGATGKGSTSLACGGDLAGVRGSNAPNPGIAGGAKSMGAMIATQWLPADGASGAVGLPAQGGGGGGGKASGGGGGSGGCGGCGGEGGQGGGGGGASVALATFESAVSLSGCTLTAKDAGAGGAGGAGGEGANGGGGGSGAKGGVADTTGCNGGAGGKGENGFGGGGGAGGISVAILSHGTKPIVAESTLTTGARGAAGLGGVPGTNDGVIGQKADTFDAP